MGIPEQLTLTMAEEVQAMAAEHRRLGNAFFASELVKKWKAARRTGGRYSAFLRSHGGRILLAVELAPANDELAIK